MTEGNTNATYLDCDSTPFTLHSTKTNFFFCRRRRFSSSHEFQSHPIPINSTIAAVASPSSRNQTPSSSCSFSYPFASYTSGNFAPEPPPCPHALLLLLWPPSAFFFHLFATVSNIVIREILLGATTKLPLTTLHGYKEVQLEPTSSWALLRKDFAAPSKYTGIFQASKDIFREEGFQV
ncbi:hypothetical protein Ahy_A09g044518 isoform A [Arachis hypogaea]|uniref:Uncharacterized protein n=1 Tax=Arachis hypogaea TaxID=3818 RepID=A0A445BKG8_ARAHY|nr:hypothetical protein Ahy_A09g044518 isoform A [Arachis hypogaea]